MDKKRLRKLLSERVAKSSSAQLVQQQSKQHVQPRPKKRRAPSADKSKPVHDKQAQHNRSPKRNTLNQRSQKRAKLHQDKPQPQRHPQNKGSSSNSNHKAPSQRQNKRVRHQDKPQPQQQTFVPSEDGPSSSTIAELKRRGARLSILHKEKQPEKKHVSPELAQQIRAKNTEIATCGARKQFKEAKAIFDKMVQDDIANEHTYGSMINVMIRCGDIEGALSTFEGRRR